jgi:hypothetical protein
MRQDLGAMKQRLAARDQAVAQQIQVSKGISEGK